MRLGLAQINTTVGDLAGNRKLILEAYAELVSRGAELVVFPELAVCGYPPRDLLFKRHFVPDVEESMKMIAAGIGEVPALVGTVISNASGTGRQFYNSAAFCHGGKVAAVAHKCLLPTYDVFDEDRYFEPAVQTTVIVHKGVRIGITICEDIWTHPMISTRRLYNGLNPVKQLATQKCDVMINLSASPWNHGKAGVRQTLVTDAARELGCPVAYVNAVGGNDELIFDGRSLVSDAGGRVITGMAAFASDLAVADTDSLSSAASLSPTFEQSDMADIHGALVLGLRDYIRKVGFKTALIALSGGIDSALVATLAVAALGPENVIGVSQPSDISSQHSRDDARILAENLGIRYETIAISSVVEATEAALKDMFKGRMNDVTEENIQARVRGVIMMAISNKFGAILLTTGNKSELAVGYCTLYGDMCGGLAVVSDIFKTQLYALSNWINADARRAGRIPPIPQSSIDKPPSAELRPGQTDQDSLPPYDVLDAVLKGYVEEGLSRKDLVAQGFPEGVVNDVVRKVDLNEYKRKQAAPGLKITPLAFGVGRRIPIVQKYVS
ncbi:MAG TPA: NAD+ synthase [Opitutaceae bacterium]|jgi:NAD+ synthase (glutamine-hydrolysing)|nr:NAD+ synthase [Opitutaceae bacterium]